MTVETSKLSPVDFCIMVLWVYGMTTGEIHGYFAKEYGKTKSAVKGVINRIGSRRDTMNRAARQRFLDHMKEARIDDGKLESLFFIAKPLKTDQSAVYGPPARRPKKTAAAKPTPDLSTRKGRKEAKRLEQEETKRKAERQRQQELREAGGGPRGVDAYPLEWLRFSGRLQDKNEQVKGQLARTANEGARFVAGQLLRFMFDASQLSGLKTQEYEILGSSSNRGYTVTFRMMQARRSLEGIQAMLGVKGFKILERVLRNDEFVWQGMSDEAADDIFEVVRCGLDCFSVYDGFMHVDDFETRWGFSPDIPRARAKGEAIEAASTARDLITEAMRKAG